MTDLSHLPIQWHDRYLPVAGGLDGFILAFGEDATDTFLDIFSRLVDAEYTIAVSTKNEGPFDVTCKDFEHTGEGYTLLGERWLDEDGNVREGVSIPLEDITRILIY